MYPVADTYERGNPLAWLDRGVCAQTDPEAFFPEKGDAAFNAKKVCTVCDVGAKCLQFALQNDEGFGVWAGYSPRELKDLIEEYGNDIDEATAVRLYQEQRERIIDRELDRLERSQIRSARPSRKAAA